MIMEWMRKEKGFISIFLCLLLLPMVTYSTMIIDASRLQMSRVQMQSAGDLAMNAALSEYEHKLEEMYGLFATATSKDDPNLKKGIEQYFEECIQGKLADDGKNHYSKMLAEQLTERILNGNEEITEDDITNFIEMRLEDDFQYEPVDGSEVCNPRIMKGQIIDYMKYKGPVSLATNLMTKIGFLEDSSNQVTAINSKIEYSEALSDLGTPFENAWNAIQDYNIKRNAFAYTDENGKRYYDKQKVFDMVNNQKEYCDMMGLSAMYSNALAQMKTNATSKKPTESEDIFYQNDDGSYYFYGKLEAIDTINNMQKNEGETDRSLKFRKLDKIEKEVSDKIINFNKRIKESRGEPTDEQIGSFEGKYGLFGDPFSIQIYNATNDDPDIVTADINLDEHTTDQNQDDLYFPTTAHIMQLSADFSGTGIENISKDEVQVNEDTEKIKKYYDFCQDSAPNYYKLYERKAFHDYYAKLYSLYKENYDRNYFNDVLFVADYLKQQEEKATEGEEEKKEEEEEEEKEEEEEETTEETITLTDEQKAIQQEIETNPELVNNVKHYMSMYNILTKLYSAWNSENYREYTSFLSECLFKTSYIDEIGKKYDNLRPKQEYINFATQATAVAGSAKELNQKLADLHSSIGDLDEKKETWENNIKSVQDDTTKTQMMNDEKATTNSVSEPDALALAQLVDYQINMPLNGYTDNSERPNNRVSGLKTEVVSVKFLNMSLCIASFSYSSLKNNSKLKNFNGSEGNPSLKDENGYITSDKLQTYYDAIENRFTGGTLIEDLTNPETVSDNVKYYRFIDGMLDNENNPTSWEESTDTTEETSPSSQYSDKTTEATPEKNPATQYEKFYFNIKNVVKPQINDNETVKVDGEDKKVTDVKIQENINAVSEKDSEGKVKLNEEEVEKNFSGKDVNPSGKKDENKDDDVKEASVESKGDESVVSDAKSKIDTKNARYDANDSPSDYGDVAVGEIPSSDNKDDYNNSADKGKESLSNAAKLLNDIKNIGENLGEDVYLEEYFTELFTCLTDNADVNKKNVHLLNGYKAMGKANDKLLNTQNGWYGKEIEYILWGNNELDKNIQTTKNYIFLIRFALNSIYAFQDTGIQAFATSFATATVGWCPILVPIVKVVITLGASLAESAYDIHLLEKGSNVAVIKDSTTFVCTPTGALAKIGGEVAETAIKKVGETVENKIDGKIDEYTKLANDKIDDVKIEEIIKPYIDSLRDNISATAKDMLVTPLMEPVRSIIGELNTTKSNLDDAVDHYIDVAFDEIDANMKLNSEDQIQSLISKVWNDNKGTVRDNIKNAIKTELNKAEVPSASQIQEKIEQEIDGILQKGTDEIEKFIKEKENKMKEQIKDKLKDSSGNLKDAVHSTVSSTTENLSKKSGEAINRTVSRYTDSKQVGTSKAGISSFTLNYKEYCKIFMFMQLALDAGGSNAKTRPHETACLQRAAALVQANVRYAVKDANKDFDITKSHTIVHIHATAKMGTLLPWAVAAQTDSSGDSSVNPDATSIGKNYVKISYDGINGY